MATFTQSRTRLLTGVGGDRFVVVDGLLVAGGDSDSDFGSDPDSDGGNDAGLPSELFGLTQLCGAFPIFDDNAAAVFPIISPDRRRLLFLTGGEVTRIECTSVPITVIGVQ